jgi:hypothetical protein
VATVPKCETCETPLMIVNVPKRGWWCWKCERLSKTSLSRRISKSRTP